MFAENGHRTIRQQIDAFTRIQAAANDITKAIDVAHAMGGDIGENRSERLEVAVDVGDDRFHSVGSLGGTKRFSS